MNKKTEVNNTPSQDLLHKLHILVKDIDKAGDQILQAEKALSFSQFKILMSLQDCAPLSHKQVAAFLHNSPPAVSRQVEMLVAKGLVSSRVNALNRRERRLTLTAKGQALLDEAWELLDSRFKEVLTVLNPSEQAKLIDVLSRLHRRVLSIKTGEETY